MTVNLGLRFDDFTILVADRLKTGGINSPDEGDFAVRRRTDDPYAEIAWQWLAPKLGISHEPDDKIAHDPQGRTAVGVSGYLNALSEESMRLLLDPQAYVLGHDDVLRTLRAPFDDDRIPPSLDDDLEGSVRQALTALNCTYQLRGENHPTSSYLMLYGTPGEVPELYLIEQDGSMEHASHLAQQGSGGASAASLIADRFDLIAHFGEPLSEATGIRSLEEAVALARDAVGAAAAESFGCHGFSYVAYGREGFIAEGAESFGTPDPHHLVKLLDMRISEVRDDIIEANTIRKTLRRIRPYVVEMVEQRIAEAENADGQDRDTADESVRTDPEACSS